MFWYHIPLACIIIPYLAECGNEQVDLTFVIDGSGSICQDQEPNCQNWRYILSFLNSIVDHMNIGLNNDRVALVQFANKGKVEFGLTNYTTKYDLQKAIRNIKHAAQNTNTSGGIWTMRTKVFGEYISFINCIFI